MPANRREPVSVPFWFQSKKCRPHGGFMPSGAPTRALWERAMPATYLSPAWRLYALGCSYKLLRHMGRVRVE